MATEVHKATGIEPTYISDYRNTSIATKMSWAAGRKTTREEDCAYSLLGLFNVNMPLIYGEGRRAFQRLQKELMQSHNDESIFAWDERTCTLRLPL
jgi:hypothetical protein